MAAMSLDEFGRLGPVDFPTLGWQVIDWIEAFLVHGPGDIAGTPIVLDDEMARFVCHCYRLDDRGRRVVRRAVLSRAKGRAKSELAGMLACAEFLGPVRFDGWDARGEPVGRPVVSPMIRCLATEEDQAGNTYDNVRAMLNHLSSTEREFGDLDVGSTRTLRRRGSSDEIRPSTSGAASKDGGKETFAVADETHLYVLPELRSMHRTVARNLLKRKRAEPWMLDTTTAFEPGQQSVAESTFDHVRGMKLGSRSAFLVDHRQGPKVVDWDDDDELRRALADAYGDAAGWMDLGGIIEYIRGPEATRSDSARYFLNRVEVSDSAFVDIEAFRSLGDAEVLSDGERVTLGFDGSQVDDMTGLVACRTSDGKLFVLGSWAPSTELGRIDRAEVDVAVRDAFDRFDVWRLYADPPHWQTHLDEWSARWPKKVVEWWTQSPSRMGHALERFHSAVVDGSIRHDADPVLVEHVGNARRRKARGFLSIGKEHPKSPRKIDVCVAAVLAFEAFGDCVAAGEAAGRTRRRVRSFAGV